MAEFQEASNRVLLSSTKTPSPSLLLPNYETASHNEFTANAPPKKERLTLKKEPRHTKNHHSTGSLSPTSTGAMRSRATVRPPLNDYNDSVRYPFNVASPDDEASPVAHIPRTKLFRRWRPRSSAYINRAWAILSSPPAYLAYYFLLNLGLTLQNKHILLGFPFPYTLSMIHALCSSLGSYILVRSGSASAPRLDYQERVVLLSFSCLYTVNILISNLSLGLVTIPFHQVVRASVPFFTIVFSHIILGTPASRKRCISLIPVVAGVAFATYGDYYFTSLGFFLTLLGTALAALKTIFTNLLQRPPNRSRSMSDATPTKSPISAMLPQRMHNFRLPPLTPLQLLYLLSPFAFAQSFTVAYLSGELGRVAHYFMGFHAESIKHGYPPTSTMTWVQVISLVVNGCIAFVLNVASFNANKKVGALSMAVAGNVKQVLTILCAVCLFSLTITPTNALGIALTLIGGAWYGYIELKEKEAKHKHLRFV